MNATAFPLDLTRFVEFTPRQEHQHARWLVSGEPKANAKGYARFNQRVGTLLGTITFKHAGGYVCVLEFGGGEIESFAAHVLAPFHEEEVGHG